MRSHGKNKVKGHRAEALHPPLGAGGGREHLLRGPAGCGSKPGLSKCGWHWSTDFVGEPTSCQALSSRFLNISGVFGHFCWRWGPAVHLLEKSLGQGHPARNWRVRDCSPGSLRFQTLGSFQPSPLPSGSSAQRHARLALLSPGA